jgi:hypothetical protein
MKKNLLLLLILATALMSSMAQFAPATESKIELDKGQKVAAVVEVPYPHEVVEDAIKNYWSKKGLRSDKSKGFMLFRGAKVNDQDVEVADLYFKVERKSRKEKDESMIYLVVGRPGENVGLRTPDDRHQVDNGKELLNSMMALVQATGLEASIADQEEVVRREEKRLKNLEEDQRDLERKIKSLEEKIEEKKLEQRKQVDELSKQRAMLEGIKARRKG